MKERGAPIPDFERVYVLMSVYEDNGIVPVQLEVKEFREADNTLYMLP